MKFRKAFHQYTKRKNSRPIFLILIISMALNVLSMPYAVAQLKDCFSTLSHDTLSIENSLIKRKLVTLILVASSVAAFATLGDGGGDCAVRPVVGDAVGLDGAGGNQYRIDFSRDEVLVLHPVEFVGLASARCLGRNSGGDCKYQNCNSHVGFTIADATAKTQLSFSDCR